MNGEVLPARARDTDCVDAEVFSGYIKWRFHCEL